MTTSTSMTETPKTASEMADAISGVAAHLDTLGIIPRHLQITGRRVSVQVNGADLDAAADRFNAGPARRYGSDNIERAGSFGAYKVEVYASARGYDEARAGKCFACGQPVKP